MVDPITLSTLVAVAQLAVAIVHLAVVLTRSYRN